VLKINGEFFFVLSYYSVIFVLPVIFMRPLFLIMTFFFSFCFRATSQIADTLPTPKVKVTVSFLKDTFRLGDDIQLTMTLTNETDQIQSAWFDTPKSSTGGPAWTSVMLTDKTTDKSVLKYENKSVLNSQLYTTEQVKSFSYQLKPGQSIKGQFSLYDMVVTNTDNHKLNKGTYKIQVFYDINPSNTINFTVD
jgi:hypothetical protein